MPTVSVLMPVFNAARYVEDAIDSILRQSFQDFEFLIVDDASTDDTPEVLARLAASDARIRLFRNEQTLGVPECMNKLADHARGMYIARMDADDLSAPNRLQLQVDTLAEGQVDVCASSCIELMGDEPRLIGRAIEDQEIRASLLFECTIVQPTVLMRKNLLEKERYRTEAIPAADYDLWVRLIRFARMRILPDILLVKRAHKGQISQRRAEDQRLAAMRVRRMALEDMDVPASDPELSLHSLIWTTERPDSWHAVEGTAAWLERLARKLPQKTAITRHLSRRWYKCCLKSAPYGLRNYRLFRNSSYSRKGLYTMTEHFAVALLSLLRVPYQSRIYRAMFAVRSLARLKQRKRYDWAYRWLSR